MGRLWQTLLLAKWNPIFAWIPMESILYENRPQYYEAIEYAREKNDSGAFIEFTLSAILDTIALQVEHQVKHQVEHQVEITNTQHAILRSLENKSLSRKEIFAGIGMKGDSRSFKRIVEPLIAAGLVERTVPDKPKSSLQKYRLTDRGRALLAGSAL